MAILIVGSEGFIGKHLVEYFRQAGKSVVETDIRAVQRDNYIQVNPYDPDYDKILAHQQFALCINASGSANVKFSFTQPEIDFDSNSGTVFRLLDSIRLHNPQCRFLNLSSAAVYGNSSSHPLSEHMPCKPVSPYGFHKWYAELMCKEFAALYGVKTCSARLFSVYGEHQEKLLFWDLWMKYQKNTSSIELFGSGEEGRDFLYVKDVALALDMICRHNDFSGEAVNVASGKTTTIAEAVKIFFDKVDDKALYRFSNNAKQGDPDILAADITELTSYGFSATHDLTEGLEKYIQWLRERK